MPREQTNAERLSSIKSRAKLIIIAAEGTCSEPQYFKALDSACDQNIVRLFPIKKSTDERGHSDPESVLKQMLAFKSVENFKQGDQFWLVLDVDGFKHLERVIQLSAEKGIQCAVSNRSFELWLLLHIMDIESLSEDEKSAILRNEKVSNNHTYSSRLMGEQMQKTLNANWSKNNTNAHLLIPFVDQAVCRAKAMTSDTDIPQGLGSNVYKIVEQIKMS